MSEVKVTVAPGEFTCFICKKKFKGLLETVDHTNGAKTDYNLTCDACAYIIEQSLAGNSTAKIVLSMWMKKHPETAKFLEKYKP